MAQADFVAPYVKLHESGELIKRAEAAREILRSCRICPRECGVDRLGTEKGACRVGAAAMVASYGPHFGEERPLVGTSGSGTIFFSDCNLRCVFCQNYDISHGGLGHAVTCQALAAMMLSLQEDGCHNINLVSPTHQAPAILEAVAIAAGLGLRLPIVYNTGGYDSLETLRLLEGIVSIYMPDCKYSDDDVAWRLSKVKDYPERNRQALREMHRQVGDLEIDTRGVATTGLLVRHLVLPNDMAGTQKVMEFLASLSRDTYVNVMAQYRPCYRASEFPEIARPLAREEYARAVRLALDAGLHRLDERPLRVLTL
jgi:putative pyruvate formate lyase activating enzyme